MHGLLPWRQTERPPLCGEAAPHCDGTLRAEPVSSIVVSYQSIRMVVTFGLKEHYSFLKVSKPKRKGGNHLPPLKYP